MRMLIIGWVVKLTNDQGLFANVNPINWLILKLINPLWHEERGLFVFHPLQFNPIVHCYWTFLERWRYTYSRFSTSGFCHQKHTPDSDPNFCSPWSSNLPRYSTVIRKSFCVLLAYGETIFFCHARAIWEVVPVWF